MATKRKTLITREPTKPAAKAAPAKKVTAPAPADNTALKASSMASQPPITASEAVKASDDTVRANVPKAFTLTLDNFGQVRYEIGAQRMPRDHAEHKYAVAHGVTIVD